MTSFDVSFVGATPEDLQKRLDELSSGVSESANDALKETAEEVKQDIERTAPHATGAYENSWYIQEIDEDEVWLLSDSDQAPHNKYIMLPNQKFVGHPNSDLPAAGIYHNVEGVAKQHRDSLRNNFASSLTDLFDV